MAKNTVDELTALIRKLEKERADHVKEIERIDGIFASHGIASSPKPRRGRPAVAAGKKKSARKKSARKKGSRKRKKFATTGDESVIGYISAHPGATTREINHHWSKEGRGGRADNSLTRLVKAGKLKRMPIPDGRGATYDVVS